MTTTLAQRVVAGLKDKILAGDLPPGHKLPSESELIDEYGVSRTVVREAVTRPAGRGADRNVPRPWLFRARDARADVVHR